MISLICMIKGEVIPMLFSVKALEKQKAGRQILSDVTWEVNEGERWLVYGLNGAGKSTLLNIINAYDFATSGEVSLFGMIPGQQGYSAHAVRERIGFVSGGLRERFAEGEYVIDIVLSGLYKSVGLYQKPTEADIKAANHMLTTLNIEKFAHQHFGLLSTGEQQRVLIARAMMGVPRLLILDEPCNGLDFVSRESFIDTLKQLYRNFPQTAVIYVTHFIEEVTSDFTHALLLTEGTVQCSGHIEDVLTSHHLSRLFNMPIKLYQHHRRFQIVRI